jgi:hypothetical protein
MEILFKQYTEARYDQRHKTERTSRQQAHKVVAAWQWQFCSCRMAWCWKKAYHLIEKTVLVLPFHAWHACFCWWCGCLAFHDAICVNIIILSHKQDRLGCMVVSCSMALAVRKTVCHRVNGCFVSQPMTCMARRVALHQQHRKWGCRRETAVACCGMQKVTS